VLETIATLTTKAGGVPWICPHCDEENPQSFDLCWNCGRDKNSGSAAG
jgi:hypothetical protein